MNSRVTSDTLVLIETTPRRDVVESDLSATDKNIQLQREKDRLYAIDWLTRLFHYGANVPHVGAYHTTTEWTQMVRQTKFGNTGQYDMFGIPIAQRTDILGLPQSIIIAKRHKHR